MALPQPYGFLLITTDPEKVAGGHGYATRLVRARLQKALWPIYAGTRNHARMRPGARLAFYVGGARTDAGKIIATASVLDVALWRRSGVIDPEEYLTDPPATVLHLDLVRYIEPAIGFRDVLPRLSFCPVNFNRWGVVVVGGCRAVTEADWHEIFRATPTSAGHSEG